MINLNYQSRTPIYEQIVEQIERYIAFGVLKPKEQMQSIRELASLLGINPNTVKKAYDELEKRGAIITISTKGTFVAEKIDVVIDRKINEKIKIIKDAINELEKLGIKKEDVLKKLKLARHTIRHNKKEH